VQMYDCQVPPIKPLIEKLFPLHRTLISEGQLETLRILSEGLKTSQIISFNSGSKFGSWTVPNEWNLNKAKLLNSRNTDVLDFAESNLKVLQYSQPIDKVLKFSELGQYVLHSEKGDDAIPYRTSYYRPNAGICMSGQQFFGLEDDNYRLIIDSEIRPGKLKILETVIPGESDKEILLWTYVCHPSMANNELSGPAVAKAMAVWLQDRKSYFTYRIVWSVETIGAISYLHTFEKHLRDHLVAGFVLNCMGGPGTHTVIQTPTRATWIDHLITDYTAREKLSINIESFGSRDSDERQFAGGRAGLPVVGISKTKPGSFPEYHTSKDNLDFVQEHELQDSLHLLKGLVHEMESSAQRKFPVAVELGEPFLTDVLEYPSISGLPRSSFSKDLRGLVDFLSFSNGGFSLAHIAAILDLPIEEADELASQLERLNLVHFNENFNSSREKI
jgi:aminopeptidase-like protein